MTRALDLSTFEAASLGGLLLSAGGSGRARVEKNRSFVTRACASGPVRLVALDTLGPDANVLVSTAVGAPGAGKHLADPDQAIMAARNLLAASGSCVQAIMPGHVPGFYAWLLAAELGVPLIDAACNGRGHPTVKMGSLGLSSKPDVRIFQSGASAQLEINVRGNILVTSALLRAAAVQSGGLLMACRGPLKARLIGEAAALGAISYQIALGQAMLDAGDEAQSRIDAIVNMSGARLLGSGTVIDNDVAYDEGFDVGRISIRDDASARTLSLGVCNEFMTAEVNDQRVSTFPDLQAAICLDSGAVLAIDEMKVGARVAVLIISKSRLPTGRGIYDPTIYEDVEARMGTRLAHYALNDKA